MTQHVETEDNKLLRGKFDFAAQGFYDVISFTDTNVGFSFKKNLNDTDTEYVSLFHLLISNRDYLDANLAKKPLLITVVYGKKTDEGITMRREQPYSDPIDLTFSKEYFYNLASRQLYKGSRTMEPSELLKEIYWKHIKPTRPVRGFLLRLKLRFRKKWLPWLLNFFSKIFHYFLLLISGDRYTYEFLLQEEKLNGETISSRFDHRLGKKDNQIPQPKENEKEAKKIEFFGIDVPQWPIVFYSALHLVVWVVLKYHGFITAEVANFFDNNFLVVLYVIISFWFIETVMPFVLKKLIKLFSTLAFLSAQNVRI